MRHQHALGPARRARGINHVGQVVGAYLNVQVARLCRAALGLFFVHEHHCRPGRRQAVEQGRLSQQDRGLHVLEDEADGLAGIIGITGNIGPARLEDGQQRNQQPGRAPRDSDRDFRADTPTASIRASRLASR